MDYTAEILPLAILTQGPTIDVFGIPRAPGFDHVPGLAFSPIGVRLLWRDGARVKPYFLMKGGMIGFTAKALSRDGTYENFTLQESLGVQWKMTSRWDLRTGLEFFHFSNAFIVPCNPGLDSMTYTAGLNVSPGQAGRRPVNASDRVAGED